MEKSFSNSAILLVIVATFSVVAFTHVFILPKLRQHPNHTATNHDNDMSIILDYSSLALNTSRNDYRSNPTVLTIESIKSPSSFLSLYELYENDVLKSLQGFSFDTKSIINNLPLHDTTSSSPFLLNEIVVIDSISTTLKSPYALLEYSDTLPANDAAIRTNKDANAAIGNSWYTTAMLDILMEGNVIPRMSIATTRTSSGNSNSQLQNHHFQFPNNDKINIGIPLSASNRNTMEVPSSNIPRRDTLIIMTICNQAQMTAIALKYLKYSLHLADLLIMDDHSVDGSVAWLRKKGYFVLSYNQPKGLTFLWNKAYNFAVRSGYKYIFYMNNDALIPQGAIAEMRTDMKVLKHTVVVPLTTLAGAGHNPSQSIIQAMKLPVNYDDYINNPRHVQAIQNALTKKVILGGNRTRVSMVDKTSRFNGFLFGINLELIQPVAYQHSTLLFDDRTVIVGQEDLLAKTMSQHGLYAYISLTTFCYHYKSATVSAMFQKLTVDRKPSAVAVKDRRDDLSYYHPELEVQMNTSSSSVVSPLKLLQPDQKSTSRYKDVYEYHQQSIDVYPPHHSSVSVLSAASTSTTATVTSTLTAAASSSDGVNSVKIAQSRTTTTTTSTTAAGSATTNKSYDYMLPETADSATDDNGGNSKSKQRKHVIAFATSDPRKNPSAGDVFTAHELAASLLALYPTTIAEIRFLHKNVNWYDLKSIQGVDVIISMLDDFDVTRVSSLLDTSTSSTTGRAAGTAYAATANTINTNKNMFTSSSSSLSPLSWSLPFTMNENAFEFPEVKPTLITIAWARNWFHRWLNQPFIGNFDLIMVSSDYARDFFQDYSDKYGYQTKCIQSCPLTTTSSVTLPKKTSVTSLKELREILNITSLSSSSTPSKTVTAETAAESTAIKSNAHSPTTTHDAFQSFQQKQPLPQIFSNSNRQKLLHILGIKSRRGMSNTNTIANARIQVPIQTLRLASNPNRFRPAVVTVTTTVAVASTGTSSGTTVDVDVDSSRNNKSIIVSDGSGGIINGTTQQQQQPQPQQHAKHMRRFLADYGFTGSYYNVPRFITAFDPTRMSSEYRGIVVGSGWQKCPLVTEAWREMTVGSVPYSLMPQVYRSLKIVIDDANHVTQPWGSVNSRVFDALASGALVLTNQKIGSQEMMIDDDVEYVKDESKVMSNNNNDYNYNKMLRRSSSSATTTSTTTNNAIKPKMKIKTNQVGLPVFETIDELTNLLTYYLSHPHERVALVERLRANILNQHTYHHRAQELAGYLIPFGIQLDRKSTRADTISSMETTSTESDGDEQQQPMQLSKKVGSDYITALGERDVRFPIRSAASTAAVISSSSLIVPPSIVTTSLCIGIRTMAAHVYWLEILVRGLLVQHYQSKSTVFQSHIQLKIFIIDTETTTPEFDGQLKSIVDKLNAEFHDNNIGDNAGNNNNNIKNRYYHNRQVFLISDRLGMKNPKSVNGFYGYDRTDLLLQLMTADSGGCECDWIMFTNGDNMYNSVWFDTIAPYLLEKTRSTNTPANNKAVAATTTSTTTDASSGVSGTAINPAAQTAIKNKVSQSILKYNAIAWDFITHHSRSGSKQQYIYVAPKRQHIDLGSIIVRKELYTNNNIQFLPDSIFTKELFARDYFVIDNMLQSVDMQSIKLIHNGLMFHQ